MHPLSQKNDGLPWNGSIKLMGTGTTVLPDMDMIADIVQIKLKSKSTFKYGLGQMYANMVSVNKP